MSRKKVFTYLLTIIVLALIIVGTVFAVQEGKRALGIILLVLGVLILVFFTASYNRMVRSRNKVKESLALIDIHLKLRFDLVPNLVETVKGYEQHEEQLFTRVVKVRKSIEQAKTEAEKLERNNQLVPLVRELIAVSERYPNLKASALYQSLMSQLEEIEDRLVAARRIYDSNVNLYNTLIQVFPFNIIAHLFEFESVPLFKIDSSK